MEHTRLAEAGGTSCWSVHNSMVHMEMVKMGHHGERAQRKGTNVQGTSGARNINRVGGREGAYFRRPQP
jgi:hypothetical protein